MKKTDTLYASITSKQAFTFDGQVAEVFPDMIQRSVPGYAEILDNTTKFAQRFVTANSECYDLGCSLGASSLAMNAGISEENVKIVGVDNSPAMLDRCRQHVEAFKHNTDIELHQGDILSFPIQNASMVVLNFTLQFIAKDQRQALIQKIYQGMNKGAVLLLSEKIRFEDTEDNRLIIDLHHQFKRENGYSELEISQKRNLLENVLVPDTLSEHRTRLEQCGFSRINCWFQQYNFISLFAVK